MKLPTCVCLLILLTVKVCAWQSNVCSKLVCKSVKIRVCSYRTRRGCCAYKTVWRTQYKKEHMCCSGWRHDGDQNCNKPICRPKCLNGGKCIEPNKCRCPRGRRGPTCEGVTCSHLKACYPGECIGTNKCVCDKGFRGKTCIDRKASSDQYAKIWMHRTTLSQVERSSDVMKYAYVADSSNPNIPIADVIWSNQLDYNYLMVEALGQYEPEGLSPRPEYVSDSGFGVVNSLLTLKHTKIPRPNDPIQPIVETYNCEKDSGKKNNAVGVWNCTFSEKNFNKKFESGDELNITVTFTSGGYRHLTDLNTGRLYKKTNFTDLFSSKSVIFNFDKISPEHCLINNKCRNDEVPLSINEDITKSEIQIRWDGWIDKISGMHRYAWEVFKLELVDLEGRLGEKEPLNPLQIKEVMHTDRRFPIRYKPVQPGMYSIILEASDLANNSMYVRQLFLFDDQSEIELKSSIRIQTASNVTNAAVVWQSDVNGDIVVDWSGHFVNSLHVKQGLLNEVKDYPPQFAGNIPGTFKVKSIRLDDISGRRKTSKIKNIQGIVQFTITAQLNGNKILSERKLVDSRIIVVKTPPGDGDTLDIQILGEDIMGNVKTDSKQLHFDASPPEMSDLSHEENAKAKDDTNDARISFNSSDPHSGIHEIRWLLRRRNLQGENKFVTVFNGTIPGNLLEDTNCGTGTNCYCIKMGNCYEKQYSLDINYCWFQVPKEFLETASISLEVESFNPAGLSTSKMFTFSKIGGALLKKYCPEPAVLSDGVTVGIAIGVSLLIVLIAFVVGILYVNGLLTGVFGRKKRDKQDIINDIPGSVPQRSRFDGDEDIYIYGFGGGGDVNIPISHIIDGSNLTLEEIIEQGKFAKIYKASMADKTGDRYVVAAKMLLENFSEDEKRLMCGKITFMSDVIGEHANVLKFIGSVLNNEIWGPTIVVEYCEEGTLLVWLHKQKDKVNDDTIERLFQIAYGIVKGMTYLSSLNVVHRRLAARNVLLNFTLEPKIFGFGPSVVDSTDKNKPERVPIRWVAPECFLSTKQATEKSDVWSYGIVLYEIFTLGDKPYPILSTQDVIPKVRLGHRMNRPELCDEFNYDLMCRSWRGEQNDRPTFSELKKLYHGFMTGENNAADYSNYRGYSH